MTKAKILIIDDTPELLELLTKPLELDGYSVATAIDGEDGLAKFDEFAPDLIICDIMMPKMNGYEVLHAIKKRQTRWIPFIMLSAISDFKKIKEAYDGDSDFYMTKPVEPGILKKNIETLLHLVQFRKSK